MLSPGQHIHFVGIGGVGISAIARVMLQKGFRVSGSDRQLNALTRALEAEGAIIYEGHRASNVDAADALVISSAVLADNPEVAAANTRGIPVYTRRDMLGELMAAQTGVAIAGTHGKTTTTSMVVHVLYECGLDPTFIIGGVVVSRGTNAGVGQGEAFVIEADEYGHMFLGLRPRIAVVTSIEHDHPDLFPTMEDLLADFRQFVALVPPDGLLVLCADYPEAVALGQARIDAAQPVVTYGLRADGADWYAANLRANASGGMDFTVTHRGHVGPMSATMLLPGVHNVQNALAALAVVDALGVPLPDALAALATFRGAGRRFDIRGQAGGVTVVDDYAHHPTAIRVALEAARMAYPTSRIWAVWQPHTFSRLRALFDDFAVCFNPAHADRVLVTDVYASREQYTPGPGITDLVAEISHPSVQHVPSLNDAVEALAAGVQPGDVVVILSAGDAPLIGEALLERLGREEHR